jgi:dipeptidyl aminopeptidase/acylaminoacyl peptidase
MNTQNSLSGVPTIDYGSWPSPLTASMLAAGATRLSEVRARGHTIGWLEARPSEKGRVSLILAGPEDPRELTPGLNVRTMVHEYGGGAWHLEGQGAIVSHLADQRLWQIGADGSSKPLTSEPSQAQALRFADPAPIQDTDWLVYIVESHQGDIVSNEIAAVHKTTGQIRTLAAGHDFYSSPRPSPDGSQIVYICWDHPEMPWDRTELHTMDLDPGATEPIVTDDRCIARDSALQQPQWDRSGNLFVITDETGWWNVAQVDPQSPHHLSIIGKSQLEFGLPSWGFANQTYTWTEDGTLWATWIEGGLGHIGSYKDGEWIPIDTGYTEFERLEASGNSIITIAASPTHPSEVVRISSDGSVEILYSPTSAALDPAMISAPEPIEFQTDGGLTAHAFFYRPTNPNATGPGDELPPVIVLSHGGPTGAARSSLDLGIQYWTTRGIGVLDVNYGGSTGFGTEYRDRLKGNWGITDTLDCIHAAEHVVSRGQADPDRLVIKGGSAGGFTTLAALTFHDLFAAGISRYGVADLETLARDTHKFEARYLDSLIGPWPEAAEIYRARSPIHHTEQLTRPMILLQGSEDPIVPPSQAEQMISALEGAGIAHSYLVFEGESHGFRAAETITRALEAELSFLAQILRFEPADDISPVAIEMI